MESILQRDPKKLTLDVVLDEQDNWRPKYLCKRGAGWNADVIVSWVGTDEVAWVLDSGFQREVHEPGHDTLRRLDRQREGGHQDR